MYNEDDDERNDDNSDDADDDDDGGGGGDGDIWLHGKMDIRYVDICGYSHM